MRKPPFGLVPNDVSTDTVECLETLLEQAKRGQVIGLAYAALLRKRAYVVNASGEAHRNPTFSRGCVQALCDELGRRIRGDDAN
jgi:hypothetical protein